MLFKKKQFFCLKKKKSNYQLLIKTATKLTWLLFIKKFKNIKFFCFPIKQLLYTFIKSAHKYSAAKRQIITHEYSYIINLFLKKTELIYFRFFLLYLPPGLILFIKKKF